MWQQQPKFCNKTQSLRATLKRLAAQGSHNLAAAAAAAVAAVTSQSDGPAHPHGLDSKQAGGKGDELAMRLKKRRESKVVAVNLERVANPASASSSSPELQRKLDQRRKRESFANTTILDGGVGFSSEDGLDEQ